MFGWTDTAIDALSWERYREVQEDAVEVYREQEKQQYIIAAFIGWQIISALGGKPGSFVQYLRRLGLDG